jgi:hypothetical protein
MYCGSSWKKSARHSADSRPSQAAAGNPESEEIERVIAIGTIALTDASAVTSFEARRLCVPRTSQQHR